MEKNIFIIITSSIGAFFVNLIGGFTQSMVALLIFMCIDLVSGVCLAVFFKKSTKTESGALGSKAMAQGLCKKGAYLLVIIMAHQIDLLLKTNYVKDFSVIAFICEESISIIENFGIMGVPMPKVIKDAIDLLKNNKK